MAFEADRIELSAGALQRVDEAQHGRPHDRPVAVIVAIRLVEEEGGRARGVEVLGELEGAPDIAGQALALEAEGIEPGTLAPDGLAAARSPGVERLVDEPAPAHQLAAGFRRELVEMGEDASEMRLEIRAQLVLPALRLGAGERGEPVGKPIVPGDAIAAHGDAELRRDGDDVVAFVPALCRL